MSLMKQGNVSLDKFRHVVYDIVSQEPLMTRFAGLSVSGDRRGMVEMLAEVSDVASLKLGDSYRGKNDAQAAELYGVSLGAAAEPDKHAEEMRTCNVLTKALYAAGADSKVFLDAICERARRSYNLRAYASCLRDCECMLALPAGFYDGSVESVRYYVQRRKECLQLERECARKLEAVSSRKRNNRSRTSSSAPSSVSSSSPGGAPPSLGKRVAATTPAVDGKPHIYLACCSDSVELRHDGTRGRHLVATRDIRPGAVLIVDRPFSFSTDAPALGRNCLHCHATLKVEDSVKIPCRNCQTVSFCTETCRKEAWETYHRYECSVFNYFLEGGERQTSHLLLAYRTTVVQALRGSADTERALDPDFLRHHGNGRATNTGEGISEERAGSREPYRPHDYRTVLRLETHCADTEPSANLVRTIEAVFLARCLTHVLSKLDVACARETFVPLAVAMLHHLQAINCNAYEIVENVHNEETRVWEPRTVGGAIYTTVSLVNHSCYPNVVRHSYPNALACPVAGTVVVKATRPIGKGREVLDCYGPQFLSEGKLARREFLWKKYRFVCGCDACAQNWTFPLPEAIAYKCGACGGSMDSSMVCASVARATCARCEKTTDVKRIEKQLRKSTQRRLNAVGKMYQGNYRDALPLLLEHACFVDKHLAEPNNEGVKTGQCIIQCYNSLGSTSVP